MKMTCNGSTYETDCFMNTVANGRRFAGAFNLTPKAMANDSLLDICAIKRLSLFQRLRILTMVPSGSHINDQRVDYYQADKLSIEFPSAVPYHVDGELFFDSNFEIGVLPRAFRIIYNPDGTNFFNVVQEEEANVDELKMRQG